VEAERDRMVHALRQSDRRKDEFLAMLAHELRNPLAPIKTATQVLHLAGTDAALIGQSSQIIGRQVEHLTRLVDDLLDVSRVTRGLVELDRQSLDLSSVVATAVEQAMPLMQSRGHELRMRHGAGPIYVEGDFHRLVQVVVNLLNNAAKYTPQGGTIEVVLERVGERAVLRVADNGVGIAPHMLEEVFDLFTQAERTPDRTQGGLGVGLALVRSLVNLHRGQVTAHSGGLHKGSTFQVELPISSEAATVAVERKLTPANAAGRRVLVVDDNRDAADSLAALLELNGHRVETVYSGRSAVDRVTADPDWEVFLLDIGLPDMTGYELASALRAVSRHADAQFVALTGYGQPHDVVLSKASGFGHHLVKPADMDKLLSILSAPAKGS
jgi:CheY-like chemotaxis protein